MGGRIRIWIYETFVQSSWSQDQDRFRMETRLQNAAQRILRRQRLGSCAMYREVLPKGRNSIPGSIRVEFSVVFGVHISHRFYHLVNETYILKSPGSRKEKVQMKASNFDF